MLLLLRFEVEIRSVVVWIMTLCTLVFEYQHLEELTASIFRVEECRQQIPLKHWYLLGATSQTDRPQPFVMDSNCRYVDGERFMNITV